MCNQSFCFVAGSSGGLFIGFILNLSDWTVGPYFYTQGFRIKVHEPGTTIYNLADDGMPLLPGFIFLISIGRSEKSLSVICWYRLFCVFICCINGHVSTYLSVIYTDIHPSLYIHNMDIEMPVQNLLQPH